jgi:hypothetical protein
MAVAPILGRQRQYGLRQPILVSAGDDRVTLRATRLADDPAGLAFRETILLPRSRHCLSAPFGAYKFPEEMSFSTGSFRDISATRRFNRAFSFSRSFVRRA